MTIIGWACRNRVAAGGVSTQNRVHPAEMRPGSGLRWEQQDRVPDFWPGPFRVYPILAIALSKTLWGGTTHRKHHHCKTSASIPDESENDDQTIDIHVYIEARAAARNQTATAFRGSFRQSF